MPGTLLETGMLLESTKNMNLLLIIYQKATPSLCHLIHIKKAKIELPYTRWPLWVDLCIYIQSIQQKFRKLKHGKLGNLSKISWLPSGRAKIELRPFPLNPGCTGFSTNIPTPWMPSQQHIHSYFCQWFHVWSFLYSKKVKQDLQ